MNKDNKFFDNTLIRKVCDCSFNTSFGFLYVEKKFKWGKVAKLAQNGLSMKSEVTIYFHFFLKIPKSRRQRFISAAKMEDRKGK